MRVILTIFALAALVKAVRADAPMSADGPAYTEVRSTAPPPVADGSVP
jgi:hypothetical protein